MNVLMLGNFEGRGWDGSITDENHIADALEELGHGVTRAQRQVSMEFKPEMWDMTLIAQWDGYKDLKNLPHPVVYWAFDYQADGQEWHERLVAEADLYLSKRIADSKYSNWQYLSQNFAPNFLFPPSGYDFTKDIEVLFTGSYLDFATERNETLRAVNERFNLVIHSVNAWPEEFKDVRPPIMDEGLPELYNRAWIVLSIDHTLEAGYHSDRNAQIMCCGVRPLFRYVPMSEVEFHDHVDYFYSVEDCLEKIQNILTNGQQRSIDSLEYAQANLKVTNRVKDLLTIVNAHLHI